MGPGYPAGGSELLVHLGVPADAPVGAFADGPQLGLVQLEAEDVEVGALPLGVGRLRDGHRAQLGVPAQHDRVAALHALSCDRCKPDAAACRPDRAVLQPRAIQLLHHDPDPHVRAMATELVGLWVHSAPQAVAALVRAHDEDPSPAVRKKAGWYTPGGTVHRRTAYVPVLIDRRP